MSRVSSKTRRPPPRNPTASSTRSISTAGGRHPRTRRPGSRAAARRTEPHRAARHSGCRNRRAAVPRRGGPARSRVRVDRRRVAGLLHRRFHAEPAGERQIQIPARHDPGLAARRARQHADRLYAGAARPSPGGTATPDRYRVRRAICRTGPARRIHHVCPSRKRARSVEVV